MKLKKTAVALALAGAIGASADSCGSSDPVPGVTGCMATTVAPVWAGKNFSTDGTGLLVKKINSNFRVVQGTVWAQCLVRPSAHVIEVSIWARPQNSVGDFTKLNEAMFKDIPGETWTPYTATAPFVTGDYELRFTVFVTNSDGVQPPESGKGYRASFTIDDW